MLPGLLITLLSAAPPPPAPPKPPVVLKEGPGDVLFREAKQLRYAQRYFEAAALYRKYLDSYAQGSRVADARFWLAATLEQDQRWDEAADAYTDFLQQHSDQRLLAKEAKLNRIRCWGIRQGQQPMASPGLLGALQDEDLDIQAAAALQLAKVGDQRAVPVLQRGLALSARAESCRAALLSLRAKVPVLDPSHQARFLVVRIQEAGKPDPVTLRIAIGFAKMVGNYLTDEQLNQARKKGVDLDGLGDQVAKLPKGSVLFCVEDKQSRVTVTVE